MQTEQLSQLEVFQGVLSKIHAEHQTTLWINTMNTFYCSTETTEGRVNMWFIAATKKKKKCYTSNKCSTQMNEMHFHCYCAVIRDVGCIGWQDLVAGMTWQGYYNKQQTSVI